MGSVIMENGKKALTMAYFICEIQGRCCPHEFYNSIEQAITDSEDGVPCDHLIEVAPVQKWISVKDRLPEMGEHYQSEDVLVCIDYRPDDPDTTQDSYVSIDHVDFNCFGQGEFSCERDDPRDGEPSPYFVTHWMPIPEPPKEE